MSRIDKGVLIFNEWFEAMETISDRDCGRLIKAIYKYQVLGEEPPIFKGKAEILANVVFPCIERRKKLSEAGKRGFQTKVNARAQASRVAAREASREASRVVESPLAPIEKNSKEKNSTVKQSVVGQADVVGRADEDGQADEGEQADALYEIGQIGKADEDGQADETDEDGQADVVGQADEADEIVAKYAPYHIKRARGKHGNVFLSDVEYDEIKHLIFNADAYIDQFSEKMYSKGYRFADHYRALLDWWERDKNLPQYSAPRGLTSSMADCERPRERTAEDDHWDEFFEAAVARSLGK